MPPIILPAATLKSLLPPNSDRASLITETDLERIRGNARADHEREEEARRRGRTHRNARDALADTRAARIEDADRTRLLGKRPSAAEAQLAERREAILSEFDEALLKQEGIVRQMDALALQAKVFTVRDRQVVAEGRRDVEARLDQLEDQRRVAQVKEDIAAERARRLDAEQRARAELRARMDVELAMKAEQGLLAREQQLREGETAKEFIRKASAQEAAIEAERARRAAADREAADKINREMERQRASERQRDREEDLRIAAFLREKDCAEQRREEERLANERRKNLEWAALLQQNTRRDDKLAEIEEARTRAALEKQERAHAAARQAEDDKLQRLRASIEDGHRQRQDTLRAEAAAAEQARLCDLARARDDAEQWRQEQEAARLRSLRVTQETKRILDEQERLKAAGTLRVDKAVELDALRRERDARHAKFEAYRQKKLAELRAAGVEEKYLVPLVNMTFDEE